MKCAAPASIFRRATVHSVIVGTGPAAAAAILALAEDPSERIPSSTSVNGWPRRGCSRGTDERIAARAMGHADRELVTVQPAALAGSALPEKRAYGSNHMFLDLGQQRGLAMPESGNQRGRLGCPRRVLDGLGGADHAVLAGDVRPLAVRLGRDRTALPRGAGGGATGSRRRRLRRAFSASRRPAARCRRCPAAPPPCSTATNATAAPSAPRASSSARRGSHSRRNPACAVGSA